MGSSGINATTMAQVANHAQTERKFLRYAMQKIGTVNDSGGYEISFGDLFVDILFEQIFEGLPGTLFGAKGKKLITYAAPMLLYPTHKDVMLILKKKKTVDTDAVRTELENFIAGHHQSHMKDNLLFLLAAMDESKEAYAKACGHFAKSSLSEKRK